MSKCGYAGQHGRHGIFTNAPKSEESGIRIGIGVVNLGDAWKWYREHFGMDIRVFEEEAVADLMLPYTGGEPQSRHAALAVNLQGGGGFEIWQYTERTPEPPKNKLNIGDLGINIAKISSQLYFNDLKI